MIKKISLAEELADRIRKKIKKGSYALHERLPTEPELMKDFGVGRSSVREAVRILSNWGYLKVQQGVGTFVVDVEGKESLGEVFEQADLADLLEVRRLLEGTIVEKAAKNRTEVDLEDLLKTLRSREEMAKLGDLVGCIDADIEFHQAIANACGNTILTELYGASSKHVRSAFLQIYKDTQVFLDTHSSHEQLYFAIKEQRVEQAKAVLNEIIEKV
ncbi:FadR/GntR family transcriptional regulator [Sphingobacterium sp. LRF_L2]|uniref:FadR/GntR family transcriptional regulator n=1 Tax=Sphingobacterium sp. LRF_L2 TaxID=3369421 RepID=UPI003F63BA9B